MDNWLFIRLLTKIPTKLRSTILKKISWVAFKPFMVLFFSKLFGNYRISLSLMLLMIIVHLARCCLIFQKKSSPLFKIFQKKTSQKIAAYKPLLIKQNECISSYKYLNENTGTSTFLTRSNLRILNFYKKN